MSENRVDRITRMESYLDEAKQAIDDYNNALAAYESVQEKIAKLEKYYTGGQWLKDFEADEAGKLSADLKRGVLSEDAIHDLLEANSEIKKRLSY